MARRAYVRSGEQRHLTDRLRWHIQQALRHGDMSAVLVLRPLTRATAHGEQVVGFDPVVERIRGLIRQYDMLEVDAVDGIGIVLHDTNSEGARAVFLRLRDALCSPIPPDAPSEVAVAVAFGYAASSSISVNNALVEESRHAAHLDADAAISSLEALSTALLDAARQPQTVLMLTLPVLAHARQPGTRRRHEPSREPSREPSMEGEPALPRYRAKDVERLSPEQSIHVDDASDTGGAETRHGAQRGHLRLVVSQQQVALPEIDALRALARTLGVPFVRMPAHLPRTCRITVHPTVACELRAVAIGRTRGTLTVAMHDPSDTDAIQRLRALTGLSIFPVLAAPDEIDRALRQIMGG